MKRKFVAIIAAIAVPVVGVAGISSAGTDGSGAGPPKIDPANFVRNVDNRWFPLTPGTTYTYRGVKDGKRAKDVFAVTHETKKILGVTTTVIHDRLFLDGKLAEDTIDWYAQNKQGDVVYFGESTKALDSKGRLTDTEGSWKAGVDGAQAGIFMPAKPKVGQTFQQEFYKGHAEDHFRILSKRARVKVPAVSSHRAMKTKEWTPLEPGVIDNKYYVRGVGTVREAAAKGGDEHLELVSFKRGC
jgi:hypothetical protein